MNDRDPRPGSEAREDDARASGSAGGAGEHWLDRWQLDQRLVLALGLPVLLLVLGAVSVAFQAEDIEDGQQRLAEEQADVDAATGLERNFTGVVRSAHAYVLSGDTQNRSQLEARITALQAGLEVYDVPTDEAGRQASYTQFRENATAYVQIVRRAQDRVEADDMEGAQDILTSPGADRTRSEAAAGIELLLEAEQRDLPPARQDLQEARAALDSTLLLGTLGAVVAVSIVGYDVVRRTRSTIRRLTVQIREGLDELAVAREQEDTHLEAQLASVDEAHARVDEVENSVEDVRLRLEHVAQQMGTVEQSAEEGARRIEATLKAVDDTDTRLSQVTERILDIADEVDHLEDVATELDNIAGEIDMLALNASLEASRAGVEAHGMDEIRNLAERGQSRTQRLKEIASSAQKDGEAAAMAIEQSGKAIHRSREGAHATTDALEQAEEFLEDSLAETDRLREIAGQQREMLEQATARLDDAHEESEKASQTNQRSQDLVEELEDVSRRLRAIG